MKPDITTDWLNCAFRLAYFLHGERQIAVQIAGRAMNKLQLAATAQGKRVYYRLTGRGSRKSRNKVSVSQPHLLQRLIYVESEEYERQKESAMHLPDSQTRTKAVTDNDLVVHFIKHLVRITTRRNSFYVTLGLSRLLYNYTTPETMELYNLVVQDPDRVQDDYYFRSRKSVLLKELKERFGELIEVVTAARGEQRWRSTNDQQRHAPLVRECLAWFTPWSTPCVVPQAFDPFNDTINELNFRGRHPDEEHEVEVNRIHATLHPECFARLVVATGFESPDERLELPSFLLATGSGNGDGSRGTPPQISDEERRGINALLAQEASRRKATAAGLFRVLVDGRECGRIDATNYRRVDVLIEEGSELVEVYGSDENGQVLLATHLLDFTDKHALTAQIASEAGQSFSFTIEPLKNTPEGTSARLTVEVREVKALGLFIQALTRYLKLPLSVNEVSVGQWKPAAVFALLLLLTIGGLVWFLNHRPEEEVAVRPPQVESSPVPTPVSSPTAPPVERIPQPRPTVESPKPQKRSVPLPGRNEIKLDDSHVARSLVPDTNRDIEPDSETRGVWNRELMGKPLGEVRKLFIQAADDDSSGNALVTELRNRLTGNKDMQYSELDQADAALKVSVSPATANPDEKRVIAIIRAVNVNGYVVWPTSRRGASWRYVGTKDDVATRVVADLSRAIKQAKH